MTAEIVNIFKYLRDEKRDSHEAVMRAMERPLPKPIPVSKGDLPEVTRDYLASWLLQGLWLEGYRVVRCSQEDIDDG